MDPLIQQLQERMFAEMMAKRSPAPPPPPSAYMPGGVTPEMREEMLLQMMPPRIDLTTNQPVPGTGGKPNRALLPEPVQDRLDMAMDFLSNPLEVYREDIQSGAERLVEHQNMRPWVADFLTSAAMELPKIADERGMPNVDLGAGPFLSVPLKKAAKVASKKNAADIADQYVNFSKMGLSDEGEAGLRALIRKYADAPDVVPGSLPKPKPVLPDKAVRAAASKIDPESLFLLETPKPGSGGLDEATSLALRDAIKGRVSDLKRWTDEALGASDEATKTIAQARAAQVENDIAKLVGIQAGARAEAGRGLRVWRQMAEETTDHSFWLERASQKAGGRIPGDKALELNGILDQIRDATTEEAKSLGKLRLSKWMASFTEHGVIDVALAWRKAGLVSGFKSHNRNLGGNAGFAALREAAQLPAYVADSALSLFTKQATVAPPGINIHRGIHQAATEGVKQAAQVIKHGNTLEAAKKFDLGYPELNSTVFGGGKADKWINTWVNYNFRVLGAEDKLFRSYAMQRALDDGAYAMARTMKLQGKLPSGTSVAAQAKKIAADPPKTLTADAMYAADYAVFANRNKIASWLNSGKQGNDALHVTLDLLMPYVTTPTNIIARLYEHTPLGAGIQGGRVIAKSVMKGSFDAAQQKALSEAFGRGAMGSALIYMGWKMAEAGDLSGYPSEIAGERGVQMAAGRQPMSIRGDDGTWYRINEFTPEAPLLIMGASMFEESNRPLKEEAMRMDKMVGATLKSAEEMPLFQGVETLNRAMDSPGSFLHSYAREQLGTMVPTIAADAGRAMDDKVRTTYLKESGLLDSVKERTPFLRKGLPPLLDVYGQEVASNPIHSTDPTLPRTESRDPVRREMAEIKASISKPRQRIGESNKDYLLRSEVQGRMIFNALSRLMAKPEWQQMSDERKRAAVSYVRAQAGRELSGATAEQLQKLKERMQ